MCVREYVKAVIENNRTNDGKWSDWSSAREIVETYHEIRRLDSDELDLLGDILERHKEIENEGLCGCVTPDGGSIIWYRTEEDREADKDGCAPHLGIRKDEKDEMSRVKWDYLYNSPAVRVWR
jgi:hypothetical protein